MYQPTGGVTKEFFQLLSEDLFEPTSGLWTTKYGDEINWFSSDNTWDIKSYELVGILFGLALYNSVLLDVRLVLFSIMVFCVCVVFTLVVFPNLQSNAMLRFPLAVYRKIVSCHHCISTYMYCVGAKKTMLTLVTLDSLLSSSWVSHWVSKISWTLN